MTAPAGLVVTLPAGTTYVKGRLSPRPAMPGAKPDKALAMPVYDAVANTLNVGRRAAGGAPQAPLHGGGQGAADGGLPRLSSRRPARSARSSPRRAPSRCARACV